MIYWNWGRCVSGCYSGWVLTEFHVRCSQVPPRKVNGVTMIQILFTHDVCKHWAIMPGKVMDHFAGTHAGGCLRLLGRSCYLTSLKSVGWGFAVEETCRAVVNACAFGIMEPDTIYHWRLNVLWSLALIGYNILSPWVSTLAFDGSGTTSPSIFEFPCTESNFEENIACKSMEPF